MRWAKKHLALVKAVEAKKDMNLSPRLLQVLDGILRNRKTNQQLADEMGISINTVRIYVSQIYRLYASKAR